MTEEIATIDGVPYPYRGGPMYSPQLGDNGPLCFCGAPRRQEHSNEIILGTDSREHLMGLIGRTVETTLPRVASIDLPSQPMSAPMVVEEVEPVPMPGTGFNAPRIATRVKIRPARD